MIPETQPHQGRPDPMTSFANPTVADVARHLGTTHLEDGGVFLDAERTGQHAKRVKETLQTYAAAVGQRVLTLTYVIQELCEHLRQEGFQNITAKSSLGFLIEAQSPEQKNLPDVVQAFLRDRYAATGILGYPEQERSCRVIWQDSVPVKEPESSAIPPIRRKRQEKPARKQS